MLKLFFIFLFLNNSITQSVSDSNDFTYEAFVYDASSDSFMPNTEEDWREEKMVGFFIHEKNSEPDYLYFKLPASSGVFVNKQIIHSSDSVEFYKFPVDKWKSELPFFITVYNEKGLAGLELSSQMANDVSHSGSEPVVDLLTKKNKAFRDFFILASIFVLIFYALIWTSLKASLAESVSGSKIQNKKGVVSLPILLLMLCFSFVSALAFVSYFPDFMGGIVSNYVLNYFYLWFIVAICVFCLLVLKYVIVSNFSLIFNLKDVNNIHFTNFLTIGIFSFGLVFTLLALSFFRFGQFDWINMESNYIFIISYYLILILTLYKKISDSRGFNKFHLIFYLCASELIPTLLTVKWFISF